MTDAVLNRATDRKILLRGLYLWPKGQLFLLGHIDPVTFWPPGLKSCFSLLLRDLSISNVTLEFYDRTWRNMTRHDFYSYCIMIYLFTSTDYEDICIQSFQTASTLLLLLTTAAQIRRRKLILNCFGHFTFHLHLQILQLAAVPGTLVHSVCFEKWV